MRLSLQFKEKLRPFEPPLLLVKLVKRRKMTRITSDMCFSDHSTSKTLNLFLLVSTDVEP